MDLWARLQNRLFDIPLPNWAMVGRWVANLPDGQVFHDDIGAVAPARRELGLGWVFHYAVGIAYGVFFAVLAGPAWRADPSFLPVWAYALATIVFGWFLLQPGMGLGWASSKSPTPWKARGLGLLAHTWFGVGMWLAALAVA